MICDIIIGAVSGAEGIDEKMSLPCQWRSKPRKCDLRAFLCVVLWEKGKLCELGENFGAIKKPIAVGAR